MFTSVAQGDIQLLVSEDAMKLSSVRHSNGGGSLLHAAAAGGHLDAVQLLLSRTSLKVDVTDAAGVTSLMVASGRGHGTVVAALLHQGASGTATDDKGATALHHAARSGDAGVIHVVLQSAPLALMARTSADGALPVHFAARSGSRGSVAALLQAGTAAAAVTSNCMIPLHFAASACSAPVVAFLLGEAGGDSVNVADKAGRTPLHMAVAAAARADADTTVLTLLQAGANALAKDGRGTSPCDLVGHALAKDDVRSLPPPLHKAAEQTAQRTYGSPTTAALPPIDAAAASTVLLSLPASQAAPFREQSASGPTSAFSAESLCRVTQLVRLYRVQWLLDGSQAPPEPPSTLKTVRSGAVLLQMLTSQAEKRIERDTTAAAAAASSDEDLLSLGGSGGGGSPSTPTQAKPTSSTQVTPLMRQLCADVAAGRALGVIWRSKTRAGGNPAAPPCTQFVLSWGSKWGLSAWPEHTVSASVCLWLGGNEGTIQTAQRAVVPSSPGGVTLLSPAYLAPDQGGAQAAGDSAGWNTYCTVLHRVPDPPFQLRCKGVSAAGHSKWCDKIDILPPGEGGVDTPAAHSASEDLLGMGGLTAPSTPSGVYTPPSMSRFGGGTPASAVAVRSATKGAVPSTGGRMAAASSTLAAGAAEAAFTGDIPVLITLEAEGGLTLERGGVAGGSVERGFADPVAALGAVDSKKRGLLHHAARAGQLDTVVWLLKWVKGGSDPKALFDAPDVLCATPLLLACVGGHLQVVRELHSMGASLAAADAKGYGAVHYAVLKRRWPVLRWLLEAGAAPSAAAAGGATPATLLARDAEVKGALRQFVSMMLEAAALPSAPSPPFLLDSSRYSLAVGVAPGRLLPGQMPGKCAEVGVSPKFWPTWGDEVATVPLNWTSVDPLSPRYAPPDGCAQWEPSTQDGKLLTHKCTPVAVQLHSLAPASNYHTRWRMAGGGGAAGAWSSSSADMSTRAADDRHIVAEGDLPKALQAAVEGLAAAAASSTAAPPAAASSPAPAAAAASAPAPTVADVPWQQAAATAVQSACADDVLAAVKRGLAWGMSAERAAHCVRLVSAAVHLGNVGCAAAVLAGISGGSNAAGITVLDTGKAWRAVLQAGGLNGGSDAAAHPLLLAPQEGQGGLLAATLLTLQTIPVAHLPSIELLALIQTDWKAWSRTVGPLLFKLEGGVDDVLSAHDCWPNGSNPLHMLAFRGNVSALSGLRACCGENAWGRAALVLDGGNGTPQHRAMQGGQLHSIRPCLEALSCDANVPLLPGLLRHAVACGHVPALTWTLEMAGGLQGGVEGTVAAASGGSETLLRKATRTGDPEMVATILAALGKQ